MRRRLLLLSVLGFSLLAPAVAWAQDAASVVKDYLAAWNAYDIDKAASYFADDVVYYDASSYTEPIPLDSTIEDQSAANHDGFPSGPRPCRAEHLVSKTFG